MKIRKRSYMYLVSMFICILMFIFLNISNTKAVEDYPKPMAEIYEQIFWRENIADDALRIRVRRSYKGKMYSGILYRKEKPLPGYYYEGYLDLEGPIY